MMKHRWFVLSAIFLSASLAMGASWNLSRTGLAEGRVVEARQKTGVTMEMNMQMPGMGAMRQSTVTETNERWEDTINAVAEERVAAVTRRFVEDATKIRMNFMGRDQEQSVSSGLAGQSVRYDRTDSGKFEAALSARPRGLRGTALERARDTATAIAAEYGELFFPDREVKVGDSWEIDALRVEDLAAEMQLSDAKGEGRATFVAVERVEGEQAAKVEYTYKIEGTMASEAGRFGVTMELSGTLWRSLESRVDLRNEGRGRLSGSGRMEQGGMSIDMSLDGPITSEVVRTVR